MIPSGKRLRSTDLPPQTLKKGFQFLRGCVAADAEVRDVYIGGDKSANLPDQATLFTVGWRRRLAPGDGAKDIVGCRLGELGEVMYFLCRGPLSIGQLADAAVKKAVLKIDGE